MSVIKGESFKESRLGTTMVEESIKKTNKRIKLNTKSSKIKSGRLKLDRILKDREQILYAGMAWHGLLFYIDQNTK